MEGRKHFQNLCEAAALSVSTTKVATTLQSRGRSLVSATPNTSRNNSPVSTVGGNWESEEDDEVEI